MLHYVYNCFVIFIAIRSGLRKGSCYMTYLGRRKCCSRCSFRVMFLAFLWTACYVVGICLASEDPYIISLMRRVIYSPVSIVGLTAVLGLPLIITVLAFCFKSLAVIYIYSAMKAFCSGMIEFAICAAFGYAGWMVSILLLFSSMCSTVLLLLMLLQHIEGFKPSFAQDVIHCFIAVFIIGSIDYFLVSPFFVSLVGQI